MGLRYETAPPYHEVRGRITIFRPEDRAAGVRSTQFVNAPVGETFRGDPGAPGARHLRRLQQSRRPSGICVGRVRRRQDQPPRRRRHVLRPAPEWRVQQRRGERSAMEHPLERHHAARTVLRSVSRAHRFQLGDTRIDRQPNAPFPRPVLISTYDRRGRRRRSPTTGTSRWSARCCRSGWCARPTSARRRCTAGRPSS